MRLRATQTDDLYRLLRPLLALLMNSLLGDTARRYEKASRALVTLSVLWLDRRHALCFTSERR
jgi:hypothetical protein